MNQFVLSLCAFFLSSLLSASLWAAAVHSCEGMEDNDYTESTKSYANGDIIVKHQYLEEPAAGASHLLVYVAKGAKRYCFAISPNAGGGIGFSDLDLNQMSGQYDSLYGLLLQVPATLWDGDGNYNPTWIAFRVKRDGARPRVVLQ